MDSLHVLTYDIRGHVPETGQERRARNTGIVTHTHQILAGLARNHPRLRLAVCHTGTEELTRYQLRTPERFTALTHGIPTRFPGLLTGSDGRKDPQAVHRYYEAGIDDPDNPVWNALARSYATALRAAGVPMVLAQGLNPLVSALKAADQGLLRDLCPAIVGVVHDTAGMQQRLRWVAERVHSQQDPVRLVAVSPAIRDDLLATGLPRDMVRLVPNGIDAHQFRRRLHRAVDSGAWERVCARNRLPGQGPMVLLSARRTPWKGHDDLIRAAQLLDVARPRERWFVAINGAGMCERTAPDFERYLRTRIDSLGVQHRVFLLDELEADEVAACYAHAGIAAHPSRQAEPFGYSNIEAMLAGVPVVASAHGGPLAYIEHNRSGVLVPPFDPPTLAEQLARLLDDDRLRAQLAASGRASARRFTTAAMTAGYEAALADAQAAAQHLEALT
ncbi:glycosyltransferase family 4 protein [Saccharopolyspora griseoalba]|uniref:Glycosyltransferase family 4 protein n=1 Tax=Saccharopolyspora griseoalba TaxID=1431848 RepID=A0ABW2LPR6_9PSEU